jgi:hypothetical protein
MRAAHAVALATTLVAIASRSEAQSCPANTGRFTVLASTARVTQSRSHIAGWAIGASVEARFSNEWSGRLNVEHLTTQGAALNAAAAGVAVVVPTVIEPCLSLDAIVTRAHGLPASDFFYSVTIPVGVTLQRVVPRAQGGVHAFAGLEAALSVTHARILSFDLRDARVQPGLRAGLRVHHGRFSTRLDVRGSFLGSEVGLHALGRLRAGLAFGVAID